MSPNTILWNPSKNWVEDSNLSQYNNWLRTNYGLIFHDYNEIWDWSVEDLATFWESIWKYFKVISHTSYTSVLSPDQMPNARWFEGSTLNYAEHIFRNKSTERPALIFQEERTDIQEMSWQALEQKVASMQTWLIEKGVKKGDCVVGFLPNLPEATIAWLATISLGAIWSSCSPDFGTNSIVDRFSQIEPKILIAVDGYTYGGKPYSKTHISAELEARIPSIQAVIYIPFLDKDSKLDHLKNGFYWNEVTQNTNTKLTFKPVPFDHPIWVLYSSGTTGIPKAITHSHGGILLEHLKYITFHNDVKRGERFFWYSTTGWMMWNYVQASLLTGATAVIYEGSAGYPDINRMWSLAEKVKLNHFGTSAPFLIACMKQGLIPKNKFDLSDLRSLGSTGSPLPPEAFKWVYKNVKEDLWLTSMSGGTDVCSAFVGGCPWKPVKIGEIQCRALGCDMHAYDELGNKVINEVGEMVVLSPMPSMPIFFWNDPKKKRYLASYFEMYPNGVWRHGDWLNILDDGSLLIMGRSDATLNRQGVRIGTSEIYRAIHEIKEIKDSLIVNLELENGNHYMPLFVMMQDGVELSDSVIKNIKTTLRKTYSPRHVPDDIIVVPEIPLTISGKKLEAPVKKILMGIPVEKAANIDSMKNPQSLDFFIKLGF